MPRHAHGRGALIFVGGVDLNYLSLRATWYKMARADFSANPDILPRYNSIKMSGPLCYLYTAYLEKVWAVVRAFLRVHSHLPREGRWNVLNCFK